MYMYQYIYVCTDVCKYMSNISMYITVIYQCIYTFIYMCIYTDIPLICVNCNNGCIYIIKLYEYMIYSICHTCTYGLHVLTMALPRYGFAVEFYLYYGKIVVKECK